MSKLGVCVLGCALIVPATARPETAVLWPEEGHFVAYPVETEAERDLRVRFSAGAFEDDNLFRLSDTEDPVEATGSARARDTVGQLGVGLQWELPVSRQNLALHVRATRYDFREFSYLDYTGYHAGGDWRWVVGNAWSGDLGYARSRTLADLAEVAVGVQDLITQDHAWLAGAYRLHPRWRVRAAADFSAFDHSDSSRAALEYSALAGTLGVDYMTPAENSIGAQLRLSAGDFPDREVVADSTVDNQYEEYEASAVIAWQVAAETRLDARVGYTDRQHEQVPERDFSGVTWRAALELTPTAKTLFNLTGYREVRVVEDLSASYVLAEGASFGPAWAPTLKSILQLDFVYEERDFLGDPGFALGSNPERRDILRYARFLIGYRPWRTLELTAWYQEGSRSSNQPDAPYDYSRYGAEIAVLF